MRVRMGTLGGQKLRQLLWLLNDLGVLNVYELNTILRKSAKR